MAVQDDWPDSIVWIVCFLGCCLVGVDLGLAAGVLTQMLATMLRLTRPALVPISSSLRHAAAAAGFVSSRASACLVFDCTQQNIDIDRGHEGPGQPPSEGSSDGTSNVMLKKCRLAACQRCQHWLCRPSGCTNLRFVPAEFSLGGDLAPQRSHADPVHLHVEQSWQLVEHNQHVKSAWHCLLNLTMCLEKPYGPGTACTFS